MHIHYYKKQTTQIEKHVDSLLASKYAIIISLLPDTKLMYSREQQSVFFLLATAMVRNQTSLNILRQL